MIKPTASLSLDLDNLWSYMKTHGDPGWESFPSYLDIVVPRVLEFLERRNLSITFFVVGQDAALPQNRDALQAIKAAGHEIANHSFRHEPWLHRYSDSELHDELARAEDAIGAATGVHPVGFRGPGFSLSEATLRVLAARGYQYDASTLPTFIGPLARAFYFRSTHLDLEQREERGQLFGRWADGLQPLRPYEWSMTDHHTLLEIPVTTMPGLRLPIHVSYLLYAAGVSPVAARTYFRSALALCRASRTEPSLLLHPLDFLGADDVDGLRFFPGMAQGSAEKLAHVDRFLAEFTQSFDVVGMGEHAERLASRGMLRARAASLAS